MALVAKKNIAVTIQELYFYPDCSKQECTTRICAWMISWIFGVVIPETLNAQALGGCYFVLSISLLVDLLCAKRTQRPAIVVYGLLCTILILTALGAIILIAKAPLPDGATLAAEGTTPVAEGATLGTLYMFVRKGLPCVGVGLFVIMLINLVCVLIEVHKFIYNEEEETKCETERAQSAIETEQEAARAGFMNSLGEPSKGGGK